jgi:hypothetical protein
LEKTPFSPAKRRDPGSGSDNVKVIDILEPWNYVWYDKA